MMCGRKLLCLILVLAIAQVAQAATIKSLIDAGEIEARAVVQTPAPFLQKAPIVIAVEVGTAHRFKRGTRVRAFTVSGALVRPISKFALSETRRRGEDSWAYQSWKFQLHSERVGSLRTPPLTVFVSVETETDGVVEGEVQLKVPPLKIEAAPGTKDLAAWVAATEFKVDESWEGVLEAYQVGDAVTRIRRFTINGAPAMAIPASPQIKFDGVQVYHAPALLEDKVVRGSLQGMREERVVFTLKAGGTFFIPENRIHWFNLKTRAVEQIDLPGRTLEVSGAATPDGAAAPESRDKTGNLLYWGLLAVLGAAGSFFLLRWIRRTSWYHYVCDNLESWRSHRRAKTAYMRAAAQQDSRRCLELLYKRMSEHAEWQLSAAFSADRQLSAVSAALMAHAYGDGQPPEASELQRLWEECTTPKKKQNDLKTLWLNPGPSQ